MGIPVELEAVAGLHSNIDWSHEVLPRFEDPACIRHARVFILEERLAYPAKMAILGWPRLVGAADIRLSGSRTRQKAKQRLEAVTVLVHVDLAIQEVIRVVHPETPTRGTSGRHIAL